MLLPHSADAKWKVSPNGDPAADLVQTRGISLLRPDRIAINKKPIVLMTDDDDDDLGLVLSIQSDENGYYFVTNDGIFTLTNFGAAPSFSKITSTSAPDISLGRDGVSFNGKLHVAGGGVVKYYDGSWHAAISGLDGTFPTRLCSFENKAMLAVANKHSVYLYDTSYTLIATMDVPAEYIATGMSWRLNVLYIYTRNVSGGTARMFQWNGSGSNYQYGFGVEADWIYAGCEYDNTIAIITSAAQILVFNGGGFDPLDSLPVYNSPYSWSSSSSLINGTGKVSPRGMIAIGKRLFINIDGSVSVQGGGFPGVYLPQQPSGLWEYNPENGLFHRAGYCHTKFSTLAPTEIASNRFVFGSDHGLATGDAVYINNAGSLTGITQGQTYFAIVEGADAFSLALSAADAYAGDALTIGGTIGGAQVCVETTNEIGATLITAPGAIGLFNKNIPNAFFGTQLLFGGETPNDDGDASFSLMSLGMGRSRGVVVTNRIPGTSLTSKFSQLSAWLNDLKADFDGVAVKVRSRQVLGYPTQVSTSGVSKVTWISDTAFTAPLTNRDLAGVKEGDECTVIQGAGAGYSAHVDDISNNGTIWTITLDEGIGNVENGNESEVQFDNFAKLKVINNQDSHIVQGYANVNIDRTSAWLEAKLELRGRDVSLDRLYIGETSDKQPT